MLSITSSKKIGPPVCFLVKDYDGTFALARTFIEEYCLKHPHLEFVKRVCV